MSLCAAEACRSRCESVLACGYRATAGPDIHARSAQASKEGRRHMTLSPKKSPFAIAIALLAALAACGAPRRHHPDELECMERAMYFESHRSSRDGMIAVGSVVMNRVVSDDFPDTVCGVVAQKNQFAPGIMTREMTGASTAQVREAARSVLRGERHPMIANAQFFHSSGYRASYNNMHYVLATGGNAFYEKRRPAAVTQPTPPLPVERLTGFGMHRR